MQLYRSLLREFRPDAPALNRRAMLAGLAAATVASSLPAHAADAMRPTQKIAVIGGGFAGLVAAYELAQSGFPVTLFEARNRAGGRVVTLRNWIEDGHGGHKLVEGGGELIGSNHKTWLRYANRFGLHYREITDVEDAASPVMLNGELLDEAARRALFEGIDRITKQLNRLAERVNAASPWKSENAAKLDAISLGQWLHEAFGAEPSMAKPVAAFAATQSANNGAAVEEQSLLGFLATVRGGGIEAFWTESEVYRCQQGNDALATALLKAIRALPNASAQLETTITSIAHDGGKTKVTAVSKQGVHTSDFDQVVLAVPPSVWERIRITPQPGFDPRSAMGLNVKFLSRLKRPVWEDGPDALSDALVSETWDSTDQQGDGGAVCLTGFSGGPAARDAIADAGRGHEAARALLGRMYPSYKAALQDSKFMNWPTEAFTMAGYSCPRLGQIMAFGKTMTEGLPWMQFAGEHTSYKFPGFMEGALESGVRVAGAISKRDGL